MYATFRHGGPMANCKNMQSCLHKYNYSIVMNNYLLIQNFINLILNR